MRASVAFKMIVEVELSAYEFLLVLYVFIMIQTVRKLCIMYSMLMVVVMDWFLQAKQKNSKDLHLAIRHK